MYQTATSKALRLRRSAAHKARAALATALVAAGLVAPALVAGVVAPPAQAATTNTFGNTAQIQIADNGPANPFPSHLGAQNLLGNITDVNVKLSGYGHAFPDDVAVLLVGAQGQKALLMSDVGGRLPVSGVNLTLDDEAANPLPDEGQITSGAYKPTQGTNVGSPVAPIFPAPAPAGPYAKDLSAFDGTNPNGTWDLYVLDDTAQDVGQFAGGWALQISTDGPGTEPQTFTVDSTADTGDATPDGACDSPCTLREAIQEANADFNPTAVDRIEFGIPGTGVHTISPGSPLPRITEPVAIDGYSQQGSAANTLAKGTNAKLKVELDGTNAGESDGLFIQAKDSVVKGLVINRFNGEGIFVQDGSSATRIEGNFVGTDPSGTIDEGNEFQGVDLFFHSDTTTVGGATPAKRNLISGNGSNGVNIFDSDGNRVLGNLIGTEKDGIGALGNDDQGVSLSGSSNNLVGDGSSGGGNTIAFNKEDGVVINDGHGNEVSRASVFSNGGLGIDLLGPNEDFDTDVPSPNDKGDVDSGPNGLQNKPSLGSAKTASGKTTIKGILSSTAGKGYTIEFYSNPSGDEGRQFIGEKTVRTGSDGTAAFTFSPATTVSVGKTVTATATRDATHDTSELSAPKKVTSS